MAWPTGSVPTTNLDQGTDNPALARADLLLLTQKVNDMVAAINQINGVLGIDANNTSTVEKLRLTGVSDVSAASTLHPFQVGPSNGQNIAVDGNEIMARNNGQLAALNLNADGGSVLAGGQQVLTVADAVDAATVGGVGLYFGRVSGAGTAFSLPAGWTSQKLGSGSYRVTHNFGAVNYGILVAVEGVLYGKVIAFSGYGTYFNVATQSEAGGTFIAADMNFTFCVFVY